MADADIRQLEMDGKVFYPQTDIHGLVNNGGYAIDDEPTEHSTNLVTSDSVYRIKSETLQENREMVNSIMEDYAPVEIHGDVSNAADEEDLTSTNVSGTDVLKFKDKVYNPIVYSGLGRKILRKNIVNGVNTLTQSMINDENTIYVIQYDFVLRENITVPANCVLEFDGGSLSNASGNSYTLTGNNTVIDSPFIDECIIDIEMLGTFDKNIRKGSIYIIETERFGITEGYFEKGQDGHYTSEQYTKMYNNGVGFTNAITWAYENGYSGVCFKKGIYCLTPIHKSNFSNGIVFGSILLDNLINFDIDLNGSKVCFILDSSEKSSYYSAPSSVSTPTYEYWAAEFRIQGCDYIRIHNGELEGDRQIRTYSNIEERKQEQTYGFKIGSYVSHVTIEDMNMHDFMGDTISGDVTDFVTNGYYDSWNTIATITGMTIIPSNKWIEKSTGVVQQTSNPPFAITPYYEADSVFINGNNLDVVKRIKKQRIFTIGASRGYTRIPVCYAPTIDVLTYANNTDTTPLRVIECGFLQDFVLYPNEKYIRFQLYYEYDLPNEGRSVDIALYPKQNSGLIVNNCYIHDCQRGNLGGIIHDTEISNCYFEKKYNYNKYQDVGGIPDFHDSTNYHIDIEDVFPRHITVHDCTFIGCNQSTGKVLFSCYQLDFYNNIVEDNIPYIYNCIIANIYNNRLRGRISVAPWILGSDYNTASEKDIYGASYMRRTINFYNNKVEDAELLLVNTYKTIFNIYNNYIRLHPLMTVISAQMFNYPKGTFENVNITNNLFALVRNNIDSYRGFFYGNIINNKFMIDMALTNYSKLVFEPNAVLKNNTIKGFVLGSIKTSFGVNPYIDGGDSQLYLSNDYNSPLTLLEYDSYPLNTYQTTYKNCIFEKLVSLGAINKDTVVKLINCSILNYGQYSGYIGFVGSGVLFTLIFENCDFGDLDYLSEQTFYNGGTVVIKFINCKAKKGFKFYKNDNFTACDTYGTTSERPMYVEEGFMYMDTTLGKSIWRNGTNWVDATGTPV